MRTRGSGSIFRMKYKDAAGEVQNGLWWISYRDKNGKRVRESSGSELKGVAQALLDSRRGDVSRGQDPDAARKLTYTQMRDSLIHNYETKGNKSLQTLKDGTKTIWNLKALDNYFTGYSAMSITTSAVQDFATNLRTKVDGGTVNRSLKLLKRMFSLIPSEMRDAVTVPDFTLFPENAPRQGFVDDEQFLAIRSHLPEHLRPFVSLLFWTGVRKGEAEQITWDQVDLAAKQITMRENQTKNGAVRVLPLTDELVDMLGKLFHTDKPVFSTVGLRDAWAQACKLAKLPGILIHDLRRSAVRELMDSGCQQAVAMAISGHKTASVFARYNIVSTEQIHKAMAKRLGHAASK